MTKAIAIVSGGMDSATLLYWMLEKYDEVKAISFDYDQKHRKELDYARGLCGFLGVEHRVFDLFDYNFIAKSALTRHALEVPEGHYAADNMKATVVPNRNLTMLSLATAWAISLEAEAVGMGVHAGDHAVYPDCRHEFIVHAETTLKVANEGFIHPEFTLVTPFLFMCKADIVKVGASKGVHFKDTWSCYKGEIVHCGKCGTCVERKEAFALAGVQDPTEYRTA